MKELRKRLGRSEVFYIGLFLIALVIHARMPFAGDDPLYAQALADQTWAEFCYQQYSTWSSRLIIETLTIWMCRLPTFIWAIMDSLIIVAITCLTVLLSGNETDASAVPVACGLWCLYPMHDMGTAGFITTTTFYLWPLAAMLTVLWLLRGILLEEKWGFFRIAGCILVTAYAANLEQNAVFLGGMIAFVIFRTLVRKRHVAPILWVEAGLILMDIVYIITCPGNASRIAKDTAMYLPEFAGFSVLRKLDIGISSAFYHFTVQPDFIYLCFALVLCLVLYQLFQDNCKRICGAIPLVISLAFVCIPDTPSYYHFRLFYFIRESMTQAGTLFLSQAKTLAPYAMYCLIAGLLSLGLLWFGKQFGAQAYYAFAFIVSGLVSRVVLGFSPTVWASEGRTFLFMYYGFIVATLLLYKALR